ncbi:DsbA family oxidoreductase [Halobacillus shinanisalinarum]|uniref:DsbA family oxidoreductase n=1 Tax=Halobacillus shinanisalinarum TaxID=2932258 RepID=A0ABY4H2C2_9BACI|nr:DsbA family oxidoreductase [Halobacillus shinanisalinarum]UOQ94459.1 DsbA family oxidoreductase [Halobacillus shinanisalinarum]
MKIEVWSDFVCPFCYIGKRRLEQALAQVTDGDQTEVVYKSFELDPQAEKNTGMSNTEKLAAKYGKSIEEAQEMNINMEQQAASVGLTYNLDTTVPTNTFDAHRLAKFAESKGLGKEAAERFFYAVLTDSKDVGNHETLLELAEEVGLNGDEAKHVLASEQYGEVVRAEEAEAVEIGVQGVPFFVINRKYAISGAQPTEIFVESLQKVIDEEKETPTIQSLTPNSKDAACTDESCEMPTNNN